ncbi:MAG: F0F1 ATP synthase subunit delta [Lysobacter sp.]|nr:F0F1 ATP synthase subunit delta [Lysobacter sp.]
MSQNLTLARPYARAAFSLARDAGQTAQWSQALAFASRVGADPQAQVLLAHPQLSSIDAIALVAPDGADESFVRFLALLSENRRLPLLADIAGLFEQQRAEADRVIKAKVTSATELPPSELATIKAALQRRFGLDVEIQTAIDESLIGGAVIDAGDVVIDGSLKGKLAQLQTALAN